jgi:hypothetical protein
MGIPLPREREFEVIIMVDVLIEEMFRSDSNRPKDYGRAVVADSGPKSTTNEDALRSDRRSALKIEIDAADVVRDVRSCDRVER